MINHKNYNTEWIDEEKKSERHVRWVPVKELENPVAICSSVTFKIAYFYFGFFFFVENSRDPTNILKIPPEDLFTDRMKVAVGIKKKRKCHLIYTVYDDVIANEKTILSELRSIVV